MTEYAHIPPPPPPPPPAVTSRPAAPYAAPAAPPSRRSHRRAWMIAAGTVAVSALAFGAVALGRGDTAGPSSALAAAASRTEAQKTARVEMTMALPLAGLTTPITVTGEIDFTSQTNHFVFDLAALVGAGKGQVAPDQARLELVTKGLVSYLKMPAIDALTGGSGKWIKVDYAALAKVQSGVDLQKMLAQQHNDPSQMLDMLRKNADSLTEVGREDVRGVPTTHHTATIDIAKLYRESGATVDEAKLAEALAQLPSGVMTVGVWIDDNGLVRRETLAVPSAAGALSYTIEFYDFGAPVQVKLPVEGDTIDMTALIGTK